MGLVVLGLNHDTASLDVRERVVYSRAEAMDLLRRLKVESDIPQAMLISTCNRTEVYALAPEVEVASDVLTRRLFAERLGGDTPDLLYRRLDREAVHHLFRVTCGLDSQILGEQEILGQVRGAYDIAVSAETAGTLLHRLATRAFRVGKRARTETRISTGSMSVAFAAVDLAEKVFQSLKGRGALLIGAGENGALCAQHLLSRGVEPLLIANRTLSRAEDLARQLGGQAVPMDGLVEALASVDIAVTTTGSPTPILEAPAVRAVMKRRSERSLVLIDIAVPRDVHPSVDEIFNVFRFDMDALEGIVERNRALRRDEVPAVERLVSSEVEGFMRWWSSLASAPVIADIHAAFEAVRETEIRRNAKRFAAGDREQLEVFSRTLVRKLLMGLTTEIKHYRPDDPVQMERLATLRRVFHLDEDDGDISDFEESDLA